MTIVLFIAPLQAFETAYRAALFVPEMLGFVPEVAPNEMLGISGGQEEATFLQKGRYRIFAEKPIGKSVKIRILSLDSGQFVEVTSIYKDSPYLQIDIDKAQYFFELNDSGLYQFITEAPGGETAVDSILFTVMPYRGNQHAAVAMFSGILQVVVLAFITSLVYKQVTRKRRREEKAEQTHKREQWETFMDQELRKDSKPGNR
ncbi:MAG: hypothetical protein KC441_06275 [Anaerolineales bacterium]|nr:hypothetical protein [Anaerolineales bacterium]